MADTMINLGPYCPPVVIHDLAHSQLSLLPALQTFLSSPL